MLPLYKALETGWQEILETLEKMFKKTIFSGSVLGLSQEATSKTIIYLKSILNHAWIKKGNILLWQHFQKVNLGWKISNILLKVAL